MSSCCDLLRLPEALLADVAERLDELEDRKNLRLACRRLRAAASYSVRAVCLPWATVAESGSSNTATTATTKNNNPLAAFPAAAELVLADASLFAPPARQRALATYLANALPPRCRSRIKTLRVRANCRLQREVLLSALLGGSKGGALFPALCTLDLGPAAAAVGSPSACGHTLAALVAGAGGGRAAATAAAAAALSPRVAGRRRRRDDANDDDKEEADAECCWRQQNQPSMLLRNLLAERAACCDECLLRALSGGGGARGLLGGGSNASSPSIQLLSGLETLSLGDCSRVTAAGMRAALAPVAEAVATAAGFSFSREDAANNSSLRSPRRLQRLPPLLYTLTASPFSTPRLPLERLSYLRLGHLRCEGPATLAPLAALPRLRTLALYLCDLRDGPVAAGGAGGDGNGGLGINSAIFSVFDGLAGLWAPPQPSSSSSSSSPAAAAAAAEQPPPAQTTPAAPHLAALLILSAPSSEEGKEALTARQARALAALPSLRLLAADGGAERGALAALAARRGGAHQQAPLEHLELARVDETELLEAAAEADERAALAAEEAAAAGAPLSSPRFRRRRPSSAGVCLPTVRTLWLRHAGRLPADALAAAFPGLKRFGCRELSSRLRAPRAWVAAAGSSSSTDGGSETAAAAAAAHATARVRSWLQGLEKLDVPGEAWAAFLCAAGAAAPSGAVALAHTLALPLPTVPPSGAAASSPSSSSSSSCSCSLFPALRELALTGGDPPRFEAGAHARATRIWCEALKKKSEESGVAASASASAAALDAGRDAALAALRRRPAPAPPADDDAAAAAAAAQESPPEQQQQLQEEQLLMWRRRSSSSGGCPAASSSSSSLLPPLRARSLSADGDDAATDGIGGGDDDPLVIDHERAVETVASAVVGAVAAAAGASGSGSSSHEAASADPPVAAAASAEDNEDEEEDPSRPHPLAWACPCAAHHTGGPLLPAAGGEAPLLWAASPSHCPSLRALRVRGLGGGGGGFGGGASFAGRAALAALRSRESCPLESVAVRRCARLFGCEAAKLRGAEPASADGCAHPDAARCPNGGGCGGDDCGGACPSSSCSSSSSSSHERAARRDNAAWAAAVDAAPALAWLAARPEPGLRAAVLPPSSSPVA